MLLLKYNSFNIINQQQLSIGKTWEVEPSSTLTCLTPSSSTAYSVLCLVCVYRRTIDRTRTRLYRISDRAGCEEDVLSFFFLGGKVCTLSVSTEGCCTLRLSLGPTFWLSLGLFPLIISYLGTRLVSWLLPFNGTRDLELSVSERSVQERKPGG
jgi:hypothetical protein